MWLEWVKPGTLPTMISWMVRVARARGVRLRSPMARDDGVRCMVVGVGG